MWELANSIRCLAHTVKSRFKIERFLFDELCPLYQDKCPRLFQSLLEELSLSKQEDAGHQNVDPAVKTQASQWSINVNMVSEAIKSIMEKSQSQTESISIESNKSTNKRLSIVIYDKAFRIFFVNFRL